LGVDQFDCQPGHYLPTDMVYHCWRLLSVLIVSCYSHWWGVRTYIELILWIHFQECNMYITCLNLWAMCCVIAAVQLDKCLCCYHKLKHDFLPSTTVRFKVVQFWMTKHPFIHSIVCLTKGPQPLPKRVLDIVWSNVSPFNFQYPVLSLRWSISCLRRLLRLPATSSLYLTFSNMF
jgi:hypothetical protein